MPKAVDIENRTTLRTEPALALLIAQHDRTRVAAQCHVTPLQLDSFLADKILGISTGKGFTALSQDVFLVFFLMSGAQKGFGVLKPV